MTLPKGKGQRTRLASGKTENVTSDVKIKQTRKKSNSNGCHSLADYIVALRLHELEVDRLLDAIVIVEREEEMHWDCPRVAIRRAVQHLQRINCATPAMLAGVAL